MIKYLSIVLVFLTLPVFAEQVRVKNMELEETYSLRFRLTTSHATVAVLDCQSFIQGLFLGEDATGESVLLNEWECEELAQGMDESIQSSMEHCLEVDWNEKLLLGHQACEDDGTK